jgi:hypothetical protein
VTVAGEGEAAGFEREFFQQRLFAGDFQRGVGIRLELLSGRRISSLMGSSRRSGRLTSAFSRANLTSIAFNVMSGS